MERERSRRARFVRVLRTAQRREMEEMSESARQVTQGRGEGEGEGEVVRATRMVEEDREVLLKRWNGVRQRIEDVTVRRRKDESTRPIIIRERELQRE